MLGPEGVTRGVFLRATQDLPARLGAFRARYDATTATLPNFASYFPDEIVTKSIEKFPALAVVIPNTTGQLGNVQTDVGSGFEEYSYRYNVQLYSYVMGASMPETSLAIKRYTLAVREAFLANKELPVDGDDTATVDPKTLVESYSELEPRNKEYIAASFVQFEVVTHEALSIHGRFNEPAVIVTDYSALGGGAPDW